MVHCACEYLAGVVKVQACDKGWNFQRASLWFQHTAFTQKQIYEKYLYFIKTKIVAPCKSANGISSPVNWCIAATGKQTPPKMSEH